MKKYRLQCLWVCRGFLELQVYKPGGVVFFRNRRRKHLPDLAADVEVHLHVNGPWQYKLS
jgi:hypothetical protein